MKIINSLDLIYSATNNLCHSETTFRFNMNIIKAFIFNMQCNILSNITAIPSFEGVCKLYN